MQIEFSTRVAGVTHQNPDGTDRQTLLKACQKGQRVELRREPDNQFDRFAIAVLNSNGRILGYIPAGDSRLADHIDRGGEVKAHILAITGGQNLFHKLFGLPGKTYGCVLKIIKGDFNWKAVEPWMTANREIDNLVKAAHSLEKTSPAIAVEKYRKAIEQILALDSLGAMASAWRTAKYPIDRLSLLLDQQGSKKEALEEIARWKAYHDIVGISDTERSSVKKREARLAKSTL